MAARGQDEKEKVRNIFPYFFSLHKNVLRIQKGVAEDREESKTDLDYLFSRLGCPSELLNIVKEVRIIRFLYMLHIEILKLAVK